MTGGKRVHPLRSLVSVAGLAALLVVLTSFPAFAQIFGPPSMGDVVENTIRSSSRIPSLMAAVSYLFGLFLVVWAVIKLKDHVINPQQTPLSDSVKRFVAGGALFALPMVIRATYNTVARGCAGGACRNLTGGFNTTAPAGDGLDSMMVLFMQDVFVPMQVLIPAFCYLAGIAFVIIGISRMLKTAQEGPRGPGGAGTITTFLVAGALLSVDAMMGAFSRSLFPTLGGDLQTFGELAFDTTGMNGGEAQVESVLGAILAFMMIIGWISFVRGFFILREVAEGNHQASMMAGMTHLFGGAMAVNLGPVLNAVQTTFGISAIGIDFS
jgi:hypothetical protein